jgi:hypothetical protein
MARREQGESIRDAVLKKIAGRKRYNAGELLDALSTRYPREDVRRAITDLLLSDEIAWNERFELCRGRV